MSWIKSNGPESIYQIFGGHVDRKVLSESIAKRARRHVGVRITAHQFRHLAAELYLRETPTASAS